jgi:hypothetical protein
LCGTRNDLEELRQKDIPKLRERINREGTYEACARETVSLFDSFVRRYVKQLTAMVPMTPSRFNRANEIAFSDLIRVIAEIKSIFDIDLMKNVESADADFAALMYHRRHVYEHLGGEADENYITASGDKTVRLKQSLHETQESAHRIASIVTKMAANLHEGFHQIFIPEQRFMRRAGKSRV